MATTIHNISPPAGRRLSTGVPGLDVVFGGGILEGHSLLIQGTPGSGRTALGIQIVASGALHQGEPGIILTLEPFPEQYYHELASLGWDLRVLEQENRLRMIWARTDDLYSSFAERESLAISRIAEAAFELRARRVLVDSSAAFFRLPLPVDERLKLFGEFVLKLKQLELTPVLTGDAPPDPRDFGPEEAAVDSILRLDHEPAPFAGGRRQRTLEVVKARGQSVIEGHHPFRITSEGIRVFPYAAGSDSAGSSLLGPETIDALTSREEPQRLSTGVNDLDALLNGGLRRGSSTLIAGMSGTGKTVLSAHFLSAGLVERQRGIFVSLFEQPAQLLKSMQLRCPAAEEGVRRGDLTILRADSATLQPMEFYYQVQELLETTKASRVVIDGLRQLLGNTASERERDYLMNLFETLFRRLGATALYTYRVESTSGLSSVAAVPYTAQVDNVLYLGLTQLETRLRRFLAILKTSGEHADAAIRELVITPATVAVTGPAAGASGEESE